ncbi:hypothetical protein DL771_003986 [Monosporascus sp. 5C6A]|nr:hypothetical protein DL771_003986 [Monosporascus sp. 5C6A]
MGHYRSRRSPEAPQALQLVRDVVDGVRYGLAGMVRSEDSAYRMVYTSSKKKVYSSSVLKYHVGGTEGQMWTNLRSWTDDRVDVIDFGSKHDKKKRDKHKAHRSHHHHTHHHHYDHHHHHHRHHRHRHHDVERELDDIARDFDSAISISSPRPSLTPPPSSIPSQPPPPPIDQSDFPDLPPAYSKLSSRPGSVVFGSGEAPHKGETRRRQAYPDDKLSPQYGPSHRSRRGTEAREMEYRRNQPVVSVPDDKERRWQRDMTKEADASYMIPEAGVGSHPKRCSYLRRVYELD